MSDAATITVRKPRLEPAARAAIAEIETSTGGRVSPEQIVWLQDAASRMTRPDRESPKLCDMPTEVGGALLWPLSYAAGQWWESVAVPIYGDDYRVLAYVLCQSFEIERLRALATYAAIRKAVNAWLQTLTCSPIALREAVSRVLGRDELVKVPNVAPGPDVGNPKAEDWGDTIALLCEKYQGTTPEYWACRSSIQYCEEMLIRACAMLPTDRQLSGPSFVEIGHFRCLVQHIMDEVRHGME